MVGEVVSEPAVGAVQPAVADLAAAPVVREGPAEAYRVVAAVVAAAAAVVAAVVAVVDVSPRHSSQNQTSTIFPELCPNQQKTGETSSR